jgi:hypothetical protein
MTYFERINEIKNKFNLNEQVTKEDYLNAEAELVAVIAEAVNGAEVTSKLHSNGTITKVTSTTLDSVTVDVDFGNMVKRFSLKYIITEARFISLVDIADLGDIWDAAFEVHTIITNMYKESERQAKLLAIEEAKKAEADKKAEERFEQLKAKALKDFANLSNRTKTHSDVSDFYYALGWLAKHIGTITATMPDYLSDAFKKYFGMDAVHTVVDSKKKTSNGHAMQWTWSFKASVKKADTIPSCIATHFNESRKAIADTSFIWDLVEDYGFSFGKKQDIEKIVQTIPAKYINSFNEGLTA